MSLEGLCVKVEPNLDACSLLTECTEEEPTYCTDTCTKQGSEWGVSAALAELYADHQVKGELVLGPELVQPQPQDKCDAAEVSLGLCRFKICKQEPGLESTCHKPPMLRDCFVNLERIHVGKLEESRLIVHRRHTEANESKNSDDTPGKYTKRTYICNTCSKQFAVRKLFIQHLRKHKSGAFECNVCGRNYAQKMHLTRHSLIHVVDKEANACNTCNKQFVTRAALINHIRQHLGENTCTICYKRFSSLNSLDRHKLIHTGEKPFTCDTCGMHFRYKDKLVVHIREHTGEAREKNHDHFSDVFRLDNHKRSHTGEKPFQCEICEKRFSATNNLRKHKLTHREKRPFPCDVCDKQFVRRDNLISHKRLHAGDKLFTCEICEKDFRYKRSLEYHLRIHSQGDNLKPHSCEVCGNLFRIKSHLTRHMRVHTGEKPFSCNICEKSFSLNSTLTSHMRTHTGDRPYGCDMCSKRCTTSSNLLTHKRQAHYLAK